MKISKRLQENSTRVIIVLLAIVIAMGSMGVSYACHSGQWGGGWGKWWKFSPPVTYCCPPTPDCSVAFTCVATDDNEDTFWEVKEVAQTNACITCGGERIAVNIDNAYPGYEGYLDFCVKNTGTTPVNVTGINIVNADPDYLQLLELTTEFETGTVIQPCAISRGHLVIGGIPQLPEAQNQQFTFEIAISFDCGCPTPTCETAYAYGGCNAYCFINYGFSNWGWTNKLYAPYCANWNIYAGAAQCDISKGELVGTLNVFYQYGKFYVTYNINPGTGYTMSETHLYIGCDKFPTKNGQPTIAPGQYPFKHDNLHNTLTDTYTIDKCKIPCFDYGDKIYIIAHATVCK